jgi:hypothetical protein
MLIPASVDPEIRVTTPWVTDGVVTTLDVVRGAATALAVPSWRRFGLL